MIKLFIITIIVLTLVAKCNSNTPKEESHVLSSQSNSVSNIREVMTRATYVYPKSTKAHTHVHREEHTRTQQQTYKEWCKSTKEYDRLRTKLRA